MIPKPSNPATLKLAMSSTPARIGIGRAGTRPRTDSWLKFRIDHALAKDAVNSEFSSSFLNDFAKTRGLPLIQSLAKDRQDFILFPHKGKRTTSGAIEELLISCPSDRDVQIVISDGLSAKAVDANVPDLLPMLEHGFDLEGISGGCPVVVRFGRVAIADQIAHALGAKIAINLIGERPGLSSASSLSAYITYGASPNSISSERTVVSNIHSRGTPPVEAGAYIVQLVVLILKNKASGVQLQQRS